jgi:hypothetical protein
MNLKYQTKAGESKEIRVTFNPPLAGYEEVKPRLMTMKADAEEALGMVIFSYNSPPSACSQSMLQMKAPKIEDFRIPPDAWKTAIPMLALFYTTFAPGPLSPAYSAAFALAHAIREALGPTVMKYIWILMVSLHLLECLYTLSLCRKHQTPFVPAVSVE